MKRKIKEKGIIQFTENPKIREILYVKAHNSAQP